MYKLLPEEAKEGVRREYLMRRTVIMLSAFILVLIVSITGLFPSYSISKARQRELGDRVKAVNAASQGKELEAWLSAINLKLKVLSPKLDDDRPASLMALVIKEKGTGVKLANFNWTKSDTGKTFIVSGIASDRQALLLFESKLKALNSFSSVSLPLSNLAKDKDISFEVKLTIAKK